MNMHISYEYISKVVYTPRQFCQSTPTSRPTTHL